VLLGLDAPTAAQAITAIARFMASRWHLSEAAVREGLVARERMGSTALGFGVAIPDARLEGLQRAVATVVRTAMPIPFDVPDGKPGTDMVVLLVPWDATEEHLVILAEVAARFSDREFRDELRRSTDPEQIYAVLTRQRQTERMT